MSVTWPDDRGVGARTGIGTLAYRAVPLVFALFAIAACGGGGGGDSASAPPRLAPWPVRQRRVCQRRRGHRFAREQHHDHGKRLRHEEPRGSDGVRRFRQRGSHKHRGPRAADPSRSPRPATTPGSKAASAPERPTSCATTRASKQRSTWHARMSVQHDDYTTLDLWSSRIFLTSPRARKSTFRSTTASAYRRQFSAPDEGDHACTRMSAGQGVLLHRLRQLREWRLAAAPNRRRILRRPTSVSTDRRSTTNGYGSRTT